MKYNKRFNECKALRFRQFTRKGWALFACLGRVVTISVLSVATLKSASAATDDVSTRTDSTDDILQADKEVRLDGLEVRGSRAPLATGQAARMVTVLTREEIQAASVQSINDLMKLAVGVDVRQRGPIGAQTDVGIRGGGQEQIAILLNGISICDPQTGHNALDLPCDVMDIERIEVLEGPAGRVYGSSSLVGAINIVTTSDCSENLNVRLEGGSFGYLSAAAQGTLGEQRLSGSYTRSDGYQRAHSGALNSDYSGGKAFYQGGLSTDGLRLNWHAGVSAKGFGSNTFYSAKYDEQFEQTTKLFTALQGETTGRVHFRPAVYWNRSYDRFELIRGTEDKVPFNHHRTDVFGLNLNGYFDWQLGKTAFGAEFRNEDIVSGNLGEPLSTPHGHYKYGLNRSNLSFHVEHNVLLKRFTLSAGFIAVKNTWNEMPFRLYPGLDASLRIGEGWKLYGSYNTSLRMPSFTELYYSVGGHKADKHLKPEELRAVEGGVKYSSHRVTASASIFHHHARHLIDWVMDTREAEPVWQSVNHTRVNTLGQEINAELHLDRTSILLGYCHLHQSKKTDDYLQSQYALEYLRHKVSAVWKVNLRKHLNLSVNYRWQDRTGSYTKTDGSVCNYHPYSTVDARVSWDTDRGAVYVNANNLTNHQYVDYGNVPQPGCWIVAGIRWRLL